MSAYQILIPLPHLDAARIGRAEAGRRLDEGIEHGLQVEC